MSDGTSREAKRPEPQLTREQAIALYEGGAWKDWTDHEIVRFQLYQGCLAIPFDRFHEAMEAVLGRPVWTHEFAFQAYLQDEYEGKRPPASLDETIGWVRTIRPDMPIIGIVNPDDAQEKPG